MAEELVSVAVPVPLHRSFDYRLPGSPTRQVQPGMRVRVPFGSREVVGIVVEPSRFAATDERALRSVVAVLDEEPLLPYELLSLARWAAEYYRHPLGEVLFATLPGDLRKGSPVRLDPLDTVQLTDEGRAALRTLPPHHRQQRLLLEKIAAAAPIKANAAAVRRLEARGWVLRAAAKPLQPMGTGGHEIAPELTPPQAEALAALRQPSGFDACLLEGVTGSGKTELYLRRVEDVLAHGQQALVLAPEIGLTPQLLARFRARFGERVAAYHSGMTDRERSRCWLRARAGDLQVVVGTRSAVFVPFAQLGLIVVDEEHDVSYKQQDGFRYSARDVALVRAQRLRIPIVLGSATPALESLHNARSGRYRHLRLPLRVSAQTPPRITTIDLRRQVLEHGLSAPLLEAIGRHLAAGGQALLFINRRGYAPVLFCHDCGWSAPCTRCDARMTLHRGRRRLVCHHCGLQAPTPLRCPSCQGGRLVPIGEGTERVEDALRLHFPAVRCERFDSDRLSSKGSLESLLAGIRSGDIRLLVGTQILAKGHDFPGLSLVGIVSADQALYGADFRAIERMGQLVTQVAGRAGRGGQPGEVLLQTHEPEHPALRRLIEGGYPALADYLLAEREAVGLPPYGYLALLRAEAEDGARAAQFLAAAQQQFMAFAEDVIVSDPVPAPMERRAGWIRAQVLLQSPRRSALQRLLAAVIPQLDALPASRRVRWSIDVDPADLF